MSLATTTSDDLRNAMVDRLVADHAAKGLRMHPEVERALRTVPREVYTPGVTPMKAYEDTAVVTKRQGDEAVSSVSAPSLIAEMLGQAVDALDGMMTGRHVLEIGSGGYNASLLAELVGSEGSVTTVDIDPEVTDRATACLAAAGYPHVVVVCADAEQPIEPQRHYDLIIVTAGAWDLPPAWITQLAEDGVLVVPLRTFGMTRSWALRRSGDRLVSHSQRMCGFVPVRGAGAHNMRYVDVADGVHLRLDEDQQVDATTVERLLTEPRHQAWAGLDLPPKTVLADLDLWLAVGHSAASAGTFVVLTAQPSAVEANLVVPAWRFGTPAILRGGSFGYRSALRWSDGRFDLGACAHGPDATGLAEQLVILMRAWAESGCPAPVLHVAPAKTPDGDLPAGTVVDKRHSRLVLTFTPA